LSGIRGGQWIQKMSGCMQSTLGPHDARNSTAVHCQRSDPNFPATTRIDTPYVREFQSEMPAPISKMGAEHHWRTGRDWPPAGKWRIVDR
jgi:hypothetical protein